MTRRGLIAILMAWLAALALPLAAPAQPAAAPGRIIAIGDLHGDWKAWRAILSAAGLIDAKGSWSGGKTILVQTGDVPDRGPDTLKIIDDLMRLQKEAAKAGGRVVALVGNHEAMNVTGDLRYVDPGEYAAFATKASEKLRQGAFNANRDAILAGYRRTQPDITLDAAKALWMKANPPGAIEHRAAWRPDGRIGRWVAGNPAVAMIDGTIFVHGGLSAFYSELSIAEINRRTAAALKAMDESEKAIINDPDGPLWHRRYAMRPKPAPTPTAGPGAIPSAPPLEDPSVELADVLKAYAAKRMVIAHTPSLAGIVIADEGRLIRIDTGISLYYRGKPSFLEIRGDTMTPHVVERPTGGG